MKSNSKRVGCSILVYEVHPWKRDTLGIQERACAQCVTQACMHACMDTSII